jgi:hypothetical protein
MEHQLAASAAAINELCSSLEDESLSSLTVSGSAASFTVRADDGTAFGFVATFTGASLPCPASLACTSGSVRGLAKANGKLCAKSTLAKAVAAAGRCVAVDLDWVAEAEEAAGTCCCAPPPARLALRHPELAMVLQASHMRMPPPLLPAVGLAHRPAFNRFTKTLVGCCPRHRNRLPADGDSDAEMADASHGGSEDEDDGEDDELLREWSKRLVK